MKGRLKDLTFGAKGEQHITVTVTSDFTQSFDDLKDYDISVEIKRWREPRSKDANAYFHVLVNKIAEAQSLGNDEVKRQLVLEYGTLATDDTGSVLGAMIPSNASLDDFYPYAKWYKSMGVNDREYDCYRCILRKLRLHNQPKMQYAEMGKKSRTRSKTANFKAMEQESRRWQILNVVRTANIRNHGSLGFIRCVESLRNTMLNAALVIAAEKPRLASTEQSRHGTPCMNMV